MNSAKIPPLVVKVVKRREPNGKFDDGKSAGIEQVRSVR